MSRLRVMQFAAAEVAGGLLEHVAILSRELAGSGHEVSAVLSPAPGADEAAQACARSGASVTRLAVRGRTDVPGILALAKLVAASRPEIFHAHLASPGESLPALAAARWGGAGRLVTTEHAPSWFPLERFYSRAVKRVAARSLHAVIAVCDADARLLADRFGLPAGLVRVISNGVQKVEPSMSGEAARRSLGVPQDAFLVGYAGALETKKGVLDLLEAARRVACPGLALALAGEGSLRGELTLRAASLPFPVALPGKVADIGWFLGALDLFVLPSHQEAMPLALLQAMSAGLPIVATRVGGVPEALGDGEAGVIVPPSSPDDLARAIEKIARDPQRARLLGERERTAASVRYTARGMAAGVAALYQELLADGAAA